MHPLRVNSRRGGVVDGHWSDRLVIRSVLVNAPGPSTPSFERDVAAPATTGRWSNPNKAFSTASGLFCTRERIYDYIIYNIIIIIIMVISFYFSHIFSPYSGSLLCYILSFIINIKYFSLGRLSHVLAVV